MNKLSLLVGLGGVGKGQIRKMVTKTVESKDQHFLEIDCSNDENIKIKINQDKTKD